MKQFFTFLYSLLLVLSGASGQDQPFAVQGDYRAVVSLHQQICKAGVSIPVNSDAPLTRVSASHLIMFLSDPKIYIGTYRQEVDNYFLELNGGLDHMAKQLSQTFESESEIHHEIESTLRWNARKPMVALQYNFCAHALGLLNVMSAQGCQSDFPGVFDLEAVSRVCSDPFKY